MNQFIILVIALPLVFMLHDFEEMIVRKAWMRKYALALYRRFPWMKKQMEHVQKMSSAAFAIAVAEEFIILGGISIAVLISNFRQGVFLLWVALLWAFSFHLLVHIAQGLVLRQYTPGVVTSVLCLPYSVYTLYMLTVGGYPLSVQIVCAVVGILCMVVNLYGMHRLGVYVDRLLSRHI